jgi:signal transduction histidine kinase
MYLFAKTDKVFNLQRRFAALSLLAIMLLGVLSSYSMFSFLSAHLLERDATVSMEFIQSISQINNPTPYFRDSNRPADRSQLEEFFTHITHIPYVLRATVYTGNGLVIWSSDANLVGRRFDDNDELRRALAGHLVFNLEHRDRRNDGTEKIEHIYLPDEISDFVESYLPIWDKEHREVVGVVEMYKAPVDLFQTLDQGKNLMFGISALSGLLLFAILFWVVRRADQLIERQHQALVETEKLTMIGELVSSITHNLRNPLAAIRSSAELCLTDVRGSTRECIGDIVDEVDQLDQWIRELLVISHDGYTGVARASLEQTIQTALAHFGQRPAKHGVTVSLQLPAELPPVRINPDAFSQVLISLIANALEAMPEGGELTIRSDYDNHAVILYLIDNGPGIPEQQLDHIFRSLVTNKAGGLGIGLPLAKRILQRYDANLTLSSRPGAGTTVSMKLLAA